MKYQRIDGYLCANFVYSELFVDIFDTYELPRYPLERMGILANANKPSPLLPNVYYVCMLTHFSIFIKLEEQLVIRTRVENGIFIHSQNETQF